MNLKMIVERRVKGKLETNRYKEIRKIEDEYGKNSRRSRNTMKNMRQHAARHKKMIMENYEDKLNHLRKKYRTSEEEKTNHVPESMSDLGLEKLSIFDKKKYDDKEVLGYEPEIIGEITLHDNEILILMLPPKFSIEENLPKEGLAMEEEMAYAKARMTINKETEEKLNEDEGIGEEVDEEFEEEMEKLEALNFAIISTVVTKSFAK